MWKFSLFVSQRFTGQNCSRKATAKQELKPKTSLIIQNSLWDGRSEAMLLGWSRCTAHLRQFLFQEQGSLEGFSCPSILPQFLAHRQPLLETVPYIYNLSLKIFLVILVQLFLPRAGFAAAILRGCGQLLGHLYPILYYFLELIHQKKPISLSGLEEKLFFFHPAVVLTGLELLHIICQKFRVIQ